ncbi:hypothetical protein UlMin_005340 [Ulmus minor]
MTTFLLWPYPSLLTYIEEIQSENWEETQMDIDVQYFTWFLRDWERQRRMVAVQIVCYAVHLLYVLELQNFSYYVDKSLRNTSTMDSRDKQVEMIQSSINNVAEAIREGNTIVEKGVEVLQKAQPRIYLEEEVYAKLLKIGVPDSIVLEAFLFLVNGAQKKRAFFAVPSEKRYELLIKWMYPSTEHLAHLIGTSIAFK